MKAYHNSVILRNDGEDLVTSKFDLNAGITKSVTVRINSTQALASIFDLSDVATANPLTTDNNGNYAFKANDNIYDIIVSEGTASEVKLEKVEVIETSSLINDLSQAYDFTYVNSMTVSTIIFPIGKRLRTDYHNAVSMDGGASYIVRAGSSPEPVGSPDLNGAFYAELQGTSGWISPEVFGSDGTAAVDSAVIPVYMKIIRNQKWKNGKIYKLDSALAGGADAFRVFSDTNMDGYGAIIDIVSAGFHNGFIMMPDDGALFRIVMGGFRFENSALNSDATAIFSKGFLNYVTIADCVGISMGQYGFGMGGASSGYSKLNLINNQFLLTNSMGGNNLSLAIELIPTIASDGLVMHGNTLSQTGDGGVFKIHTCTNSNIYDNTFVRTTDVGGSQSQAVMLGGQSGGKETHYTNFHDNRITDANGSLAALFIGNTSDNTTIRNNKILGAGSIIWVGGSITDSIIEGNEVALIQSLGATNAISNLKIRDNDILAIDFRLPAGGNVPLTIDNLSITGNKISSNIKINAATSSSAIFISRNKITNANTLSVFDTENITFSYNTVISNDGYVSTSQLFNVTSGALNYKQFNNTWDLKGQQAFATTINTGVTGAQIIGETVEDATASVVSDSGTSTELFHNKIKLSGGGGWVLV